MSVTDDPETWDEERLQEECSELWRRCASAEHDRDKYDRRRAALTSTIAPLLRIAEVEDDHVEIPLGVWDDFKADLAAISYGRIPKPRGATT